VFFVFGNKYVAVLPEGEDAFKFVNRLIYLNPEGREQTNKKRAIVPINDRLYETLIETQTELRRKAEEREKKDLPPLPPCSHLITYHNAPAKDVRIGFSNKCSGRWRRIPERHRACHLASIRKDKKTRRDLAD